MRRELGQTVEVVDGDGPAVRDLRDAGVPGRGQEALDARAARETPRQCVLPSATADDERFHPTWRLCSRAGPTETTETGTPASSWIRPT